MAKFNAAAVEPLEYDLSSFKPDPEAAGLEEHERDRRRELNARPDWVGVIPEPAEEAVRVYFATLTDLSLRQAEDDETVIAGHRADQIERWRGEHPEQDGSADPSPAELSQWDSAHRLRAHMTELAEARAKSRDAVRDDLCSAVAAFCSDTPSAAVLDALPWRALQMFVGWLSGQFSPEAVAAAMSS